MTWHSADIAFCGIVRAGGIVAYSHTAERVESDTQTPALTLTWSA